MPHCKVVGSVVLSHNYSRSSNFSPKIAAEQMVSYYVGTGVFFLLFFIQDMGPVLLYISGTCMFPCGSGWGRIKI